MSEFTELFQATPSPPAPVSRPGAWCLSDRRLLAVSWITLSLVLLAVWGPGLADAQDPGDRAHEEPGVAAGPDQLLRRVMAVQSRLQSLIARVEPTVVTIAVRLQDVALDGSSRPRGQRRWNRPGTEPDPRSVLGSGSGVIIDRTGYVLTNEHVVAEADRVSVGLADGRYVEGRVAGRDRLGDLAVVKLPAGTYPHAEIGDSDLLRVGERVLAMGDPFGLSDDNKPAASLGIVSGLHRYQGGSKVYGDAIQVDAALNPGNSGGPLFDMRGRLVGITGRISIRGGDRFNVGVGFAVPINQVLLVLDDLKAGRDVRHGFLGVRFAVEREDDAGGVIVEAVIAGSAADHAGLRPGDHVVEFDGRSIDNPTRFQNFISVLPAGAIIRLGILRGSRSLEIVVELDARPE